MELAKKEKPDLIVLDILLPRENGISFLKQRQEDKEIAGIPVIAFSNYDDKETIQEAMKLGAQTYLIKANFTPSQIVEKIKKYLA